MTTELVPIPRLPIPLDAFEIHQSPTRVTFTLTDIAVARMSRDDFEMIRSFFDAALEFARMAGYSTFTEYRDVLRFATVFSFVK